jgi:ABC-type branched-subunit amino acid transport system substrate-binding protein
VADLEAIRAAGISIPETLTTDHLYDRWNVFAERWNAAGGINGRQIELVRLVWDPLNPSTFDTLCATATVDEELFVLLNGTGLSSVAMQCVVDAGIPIIYGDVVSQDLLDTGSVIALAPPAEVVARAGIQAWLADTDLAPGAKVGVLASNTPLVSAAGAAAAEVLNDAGYDVQVIETNSLAGDNAATVEEGAAAVGTFLANGAEHVFLATPFTENGGFWAAAAGQLPYTLLDTNASQCSTFGLSRAPGGAAGGACVTSYDHPTSEGEGVRPDTEFEAECRAFFDESFTEYYGGPSDSGVPAGQKITDTTGKVLNSDYPPQECTIAVVLERALAAAGVNPTRASLIEATLNLGEVDMALASNGIGSFAPGKPYAADFVHAVRITTAGPDVAPDANGTYNGCAAPVSCGIVVGDWIAI